MILFSNKTLQAAWLTGFIWLMIFLIVELIRPGLVITRFVFILWWGLLTIALLIIPKDNKKGRWLDVLLATLASVILLLIIPDWLIGVVVAIGTFILISLTKYNE